MSNGIPVEIWNTLSAEQKSAIAAAMAEQAKAKAGKLTVKVSNKGAVSIYGLNRFPVTLYAEQWARVFAEKATVEKFIEDNKVLIAERLANPIVNKED